MSDTAQFPGPVGDRTVPGGWSPGCFRIIPAQAHRPAWVNPPWLYLRSGTPSYFGGSAWLLLLLNRKTGFLASPSGRLP